MQRGIRPHGGSAKKLTVAWHFSRAGGWTKPEFKCEHCKAEKLHAKRNCSQFPEDWQSWRRQPAWVRKIEWMQPGRNGEAPTPRSESIRSSATAECPVSLVTPESMFLVELIHGSQITNETMGATLFGADTRRWPAVYHDAVRVVAAAKLAEDVAKSKQHGGN